MGQTVAEKIIAAHIVESEGVSNLFRTIFKVKF